jgi:transcriptional regulator GlxA family with amidase domain
MIYVRDHNIYTSAGVTAGIDLALAMVEEDFGRELALEVAKQLVVFMKRQGGQSQFSTALARQHVMDNVIKDTLNWVHHNPEKDLSMETLASQSAMSERNFNRVFKKEVGMPPGKYVEKMRVELATNLIETSDNNLQQIAVRSGFLSEEKMRRVFKKQLGVLPHVYRKRFGK